MARRRSSNSDGVEEGNIKVYKNLIYDNLMTWEEILNSVIIPAIVAAVISIFGLWSKWGIEKKKTQLERRRHFINRCKDRIDTRDFNPDSFRESALYFNLKHYLSTDTNNDIQKKRYNPGTIMGREESIKISREENNIKQKLLDELSSLERKWGLL